MNYLELTIADFAPFDLTTWTIASDVKTHAESLLPDELSAGQWRKLKTRLGLTSENIQGTWYVCLADHVPTPDPLEGEVVEEPTTQAPQSPGFYSFGDYSANLTVINSPGANICHPNISTSELGTSVDAFQHQVAEFGRFLSYAEQKLNDRENEIRKALEVKAAQIHETRLKTSELQARIQAAQENAIAAKVADQQLEIRMAGEVELGKVLYSQLQQLE